MAEPTNRSPWHALTWLAWAVAGSVCIQLAPNPLYVGLVVGIAWVVVTVHGHDGPFARAFPVLVAFAVVFAVLRVALAALTTHGDPDVWFTLPSFTVPEVLGGFAIGGTVEGPVVARAAADGLVIIGILAVFGAFNAVASHHELVQALPRAFHEVGLVVVVALAFVPSTIAAAHAVVEADRARTGGRAVRKGRLVRRLVPVLETGLERAVGLSESLDSRGFAHGSTTARERGAGWCGATALLGLGATFVALIARERTMAVGLAVASLVAVAVAVVLAGRGSDRVRYRRRRLAGADWGCLAVVAAAPVVLGVLGGTTLDWVTSPLRWPQLDLLAVLALLPLLAPLARPSASRTVHPPEPIPATA